VAAGDLLARPSVAVSVVEIIKQQLGGTMETESKEVAVSGQAIPINAVASDVEQSVRAGSMSFDDLQRLGKLIAAAGYFNDVRDVSQAVVKMLAGAELGFGPIASMTGIHVIKGKVVPGANLLAAKVRKSGYDYRIREHTAERCKIEFFRGVAPKPGEKGESLGFSTFTAETARAAGLFDKSGSIWPIYTQAMLFARAMSQGVRWHCADCTNGVTIYTEDEAQAIKPQARRYTYDPELDGGSREAQRLTASDKIAEFNTQEADRATVPATNGAPARLNWDDFSAEQRALVLPMLITTLDARGLPHEEASYRECVGKWEGGLAELLEQARALQPMQEKSAKRKRKTKANETQSVAEIAEQTNLGI
jgi:hypothetical protein